MQMDFEEFSGIVEMDETYFLYSEKGKDNIDGPSLHWDYFGFQLVLH